MKLTTITVYKKDLREMVKYRRRREIVPKKNSGRGRGPSIMESNADMFHRILETFKREQE